MNIRKILCFVMVSVLMLATCTNAFAENVKEVDAVTSVEALRNQASAEYRTMDAAVGNILEAYDTEINGDNALDYYALATSMSESKADRVAAMNFIITIFDTVTCEEQKKLKSYLFSYAPYADEENLQAFCDEIKVSRPQSRTMYGGQAAVNYALAYYNSYNPLYPNLSNYNGDEADCANFASQCLYAGGATMDNEWFVEKLNNQYPAPTRVQELNTSWEVADPSPWISAAEFNVYWSERATEVYTYTTEEYENNHQTIYLQSIYKGYPVQILGPELWWYQAWHTMIIVDYNIANRDFVYAQHSPNKRDGEILYNVCGNSDYDDDKIRFFYFQHC